MLGEQVAFLQCATTIRNTGWYAGWNVTGNSWSSRSPVSRFWGHIFTDLWPPLRRTQHELGMCWCTRTLAWPHPRLRLRDCVICVFSGETHGEKEHEMCLSADERSSEESVWKVCSGWNHLKRKWKIHLFFMSDLTHQLNTSRKYSHLKTA